jgi:hypothetical protein
MVTSFEDANLYMKSCLKTEVTYEKIQAQSRSDINNTSLIRSPHPAFLCLATLGFHHMKEQSNQAWEPLKEGLRVLSRSWPLSSKASVTLLTPGHLSILGLLLLRVTSVLSHL